MPSCFPLRTSLVVLTLVAALAAAGVAFLSRTPVAHGVPASPSAEGMLLRSEEEVRGAWGEPDDVLNDYPEPGVSDFHLVIWQFKRDGRLVRFHFAPNGRVRKITLDTL